MTDPLFQIRSMSRQEVDLAVEWSVAEGWNPGLYEADAFHTADPDGFLIGLLDDEPVACISAVRYGQSYGFIGLHIVRPDQRGQGIGRQIWDAALQHLEGRIIGLNGMAAQQQHYLDHGFQLAWHNVRYRGLSGGLLDGNAPTIDLSILDFAQISAFDREFFPDDRTRFLQPWLQQAGGHALGILDGHGELCGYGMARHCRNGFRIGPLYARTAEQASQLLNNLKARLPEGAPLFIDVPDCNSQALELVQSQCMQAEFETARMYNGPTPRINLQQTYGITSFELG